MPFIPNIVGAEIAYAHNGLLHGIYAMPDFDNLENEIHNQEESAVPKVGSYMPSHFLWRADFLCGCGFVIFGKPNTSNWKYGITFDIFLSMLHVDCNEETSTKWCGLVYKLGT